MFRTILSNWLIPAIALTFVLLAVAFFAPDWSGAAAGIILCLILAIAVFSLVRKQSKLYREKRINRITLVRNVLYEVMGILLAMILAFVIGRYITEIATGQIGNDLIRFIAGIVISLLAGMSVGFLVQRTWGRLAQL